MTLYTGCECNEMTLILHKVVDLKVYGIAHHSEAIENISIGLLNRNRFFVCRPEIIKKKNKAHTHTHTGILGSHFEGTDVL